MNSSLISISLLGVSVIVQAFAIIRLTKRIDDIECEIHSISNIRK